MAFRPINVIGILISASLLVAGSASAQQADDGPGSVALPAGLEAFLDGRLLESEERYREALAAYDRALREDPSVAEVRIAYGNLLFRLGMADRAVSLLEGIDGLDWHGRRVYALALAQYSVQRTERSEEARLALEEVLDERDDDPNLLLALAQLLHRMGRVDEAEAVIAELRANRPGSPQLASYHASLLLQLGRREDAAELFAICAASPITRAGCLDNAVDLLIEAGRPGEAAELMLESLSDDDLDQLMRAAYLLWDANRPSQALEVVERVLRQVPDSERARTLRAHLLAATGQPAEAATILRPLVKKNPDDLDLKLSLAWALARSGELAESRRWLDRAWETVSSDAGSEQAAHCAVTGARVELVSGNPLVAREWLARVADPSVAGEEYVRLLGECFRQQEDWSDGIAALTRLQPALPERARHAAEAIEAEFRFRSSDRLAWRRLRPLLDADDPEVVSMGLQVLQATERWSDAEREAGAALERFPENREILFARAASLERLGRFEDAESAFIRLLERDPGDASAANYLGYLWADRSVRLEEALELINRAVAADPENAAYLDSLGWVHYRLGSLAEAEFWLRRAIEVNDTDGTLFAHLGEVLLELGRTDEATRYLRLALDLGCEDPGHVQFLLDGVRDAPTP
jgi:tetratricopeptide (TPR) repeat protein